MRNITIKRNKSFVASLEKMKVYLEDVAGEEEIEGVRCKKVGDLKNGKEMTFQADYAPLKIFVIAGKASKTFCVDSYQLDEGTDDVYLTGENRYNPMQGNRFVFDANYTPDVEKSNKKNVVKYIAILVASVLVGVGIGVYRVQKSTSKDETFTTAGVTITLTNKFEKVDYEGYDLGFESQQIAMWGFKEPFDTFEGFKNYTLEEYIGLLEEANSFGVVEIKNKDGLTYFEHVDTVDNITYHYFSYVFKTHDAFWCFQFACFETNVDLHRDTIMGFAKTIEFAKQETL